MELFHASNEEKRPSGSGDQIKSPRKISRRSLLKGAAVFGAAKALSQMGVEEAEAKGERDISNAGRVKEEARKASILIEGADPVRFLESRYLVSALYYSDRFLRKLSRGEGVSDVSEEIIAQIAGKVTSGLREQFMSYLGRKFAAEVRNGQPKNPSPPLIDFIYGRGQNHPDAIDLFIEEGALVYTMRSGIAVLADRGWKKDNSFSTSSLKGGNTVIVYAPDTKEFYRYCHLRDVLVKAGEFVMAGQTIGSVGHSGSNASKPGRGKHLHLEINRYYEREKEMRPLFEAELKNMVEQAKRKHRMFVGAD
ncbi:MAG: M23 family metallopeptidase [Candidatus Sungbacteria bacterium]|nr:M23 family metallopeptidase [Candidatus Sungbacteria bacterium]